MDRRSFAKSVTGVVGAALPGTSTTTSAQAPSAAPRAASRLSPAKVTRIRLFYPPNYDRNGPQAFPQSNMVVLVDTEAGITGIGQGGSPDTVRNIARSVIGKNAFDTEIDLAGRVHGRVLLARQGAAARARRDRPGAVGHQGQGARTRRCTSCSAARRASTSSCMRPSACRRGWCRRPKPQAMRLEGARGADDGGRLSRVSRGQRHPAESRGPGAGRASAAVAARVAATVFNSRSRIPRSSRRSRRSAKASARTATG